MNSNSLTPYPHSHSWRRIRPDGTIAGLEVAPMIDETASNPRQMARGQTYRCNYPNCGETITVSARRLNNTGSKLLQLLEVAPLRLLIAVWVLCTFVRKWALGPNLNLIIRSVTVKIYENTCFQTLHISYIESGEIIIGVLHQFFPITPEISAPNASCHKWETL